MKDKKEAKKGFQPSDGKRHSGTNPSKPTMKGRGLVKKGKKGS